MWLPPSLCFQTVSVIEHRPGLHERVLGGRQEPVHLPPEPELWRVSLQAQASRPGGSKAVPLCCRVQLGDAIQVARLMQ